VNVDRNFRARQLRKVTPHKEAVLLVGNYRPSIAVARSLGRAGYKVIVGRDRRFSFAEKSRYCAGTWSHPPIEEAEQFLAALVEMLAHRLEISMIFPIEQPAVALLARRRAILPAHVTLVDVSSEVLETCLDKTRMFAVARAAGVPVEPYEIAEELDTLVSAAARTGYPTIVRPVGAGPERLPDGRKAVICDDSAALAREFAAWPEGHARLLVQKFSPGPRHNIHFAAVEGRLVGRVENVVLRTDRADGTGFTVAGVSVAPDPELDHYTAALVAALRYTGVGLLQFLHFAGRRYHFLELNPRLGSAYIIADRCGLDLARLACEISRGSIFDAQDCLTQYPAGIRYVWTLGDLRGLAGAWRRGEVSLPGALRWGASALISAVRADVHLTWSVGDPAPALHLYAMNAPLGLGGLLARKRSGANGVQAGRL
jgi:predicted ATP-grasp superfamily ATP-dependent carboligase